MMDPKTPKPRRPQNISLDISLDISLEINNARLHFVNILVGGGDSAKFDLLMISRFDCVGGCSHLQVDSGLVSNNFLCLLFKSAFTCVDPLVNVF